MMEGLLADPVSIRHHNPAHAQVVLVDWMLGNTCNYQCSYCPTGLHDGSLRWQKLAEIEWMFRELRSHYVDGLGRQVWVQFTGGEPTLHPEIVPVLEAATAHGFQVSLISNGSRTLRFWNKIAPHLDSVILTYHHEFVDHAHFISVCALLDSLMPVHVNVTVHPDKFDQILELAEGIGRETAHASIVLKPLRKDFGQELYDYDDDQLLRLRHAVRSRRGATQATPRGLMLVEHADGTREERRASSFIVDGSNRWRGYRCEAGIESLRVKGDGTVLRAVCGAGGPLGKLGEELYLPVSSIVCDRSSCACVADILVTKSR